MTAGPELRGVPVGDSTADVQTAGSAPPGVTANDATVGPARAGPNAARQRGTLSGFAPFESPGFRNLFAGTTLTMAGYFMQMVTQGWLIYDLTGSPVWLGIVSFANGIPMLVLALPAGVLVDRFDRRLVLSVAQGFTALTAIILAVMIWLQVIEPWHVALLAFLSGCFFVGIVPARQALLPTTVERASLSAAIAMMSAGTNFGRVIGPSVGGLAIAALGAAMAFALQGVAFVLAPLAWG